MNIDIASSNNFIFKDARIYDAIISTDTDQQKIIIGTSQTQVLSIAKERTDLFGRLRIVQKGQSLSSNDSVTNPNTSPPQYIISSGSNTYFSVNGDTVYIPSPSNLAIGTANALAPLHVEGDAYISNTLRALKLQQNGSNIALESHTHSNFNHNITVTGTLNATILQQNGSNIALSNHTHSNFNHNVTVTGTLNATTLQQNGSNVAMSNHTHSNFNHNVTVTGTLNATTLQQNGSNIAMSNHTHSNFNNDVTVTGTLNATTLQQNGSNVAMSNHTHSNFNNDVTVTGTLNATTLQQNGSNIALSNHTHYSFDNEVTVNSNLYVKGNIIPTDTLTYDLGSSNNRFRDLYLSGNTIDMAGTKITIDNSNNMKITDSQNNLRKLVVDEIQIGENTASNMAVRIRKEAAGIKFYTVQNNIETADTSMSSGTAGGITLSNISQTISSISPANGYTASTVTIPTINIETVPSNANISYGRVTFGAHNGLSLANNATTTVTITHNLNTTDYFVYAMPELGSSIQTNISNYTSNAFTMSIKNVSGASIANPAVNYQIVQAPRQTSNVVMAAPVTVTTATSNIIAYSGPSSTGKTIPLSSMINDPYVVGFRVSTDTTSNASVNGSNLVYAHKKVSGPAGSVTITASNIYNNTPVTFTYNVVESNLANILNSLGSTASSNQSTTGIITTSSNLPATDQGLPLVWTAAGSGATPLSSVSIVGSNVAQWNTAGVSGTRTATLTSSFAPVIMAEALLPAKTITMTFIESYVSPSRWTVHSPTLVLNTMPNAFLTYTFDSPVSFNYISVTGFPTRSMGYTATNNNVRMSFFMFNNGNELLTNYINTPPGGTSWNNLNATNLFIPGTTNVKYIRMSLFDWTSGNPISSQASFASPLTVSDMNSVIFSTSS